MFSIGKIFTLIIILLAITFIFKILSKKRKPSKVKDPKNLDWKGENINYLFPNCVEKPSKFEAIVSELIITPVGQSEK